METVTEHMAREYAERLLATLAGMADQLTREIDTLNEHLLDIDREAVASPCEKVVRQAESVEQAMKSAEGQIRVVLSRWAPPEFPPLDLSNVPTPVMYGATDEEAAKHGMKGSVHHD